MKNEGVCSGFDLGLFGVENEERRKKRTNSGSTRKEIECVKLDFHYHLESLRLELRQ